MKRKNGSSLPPYFIVVLAGLWLGAPLPAIGQQTDAGGDPRAVAGTAFTYQGLLKSAGVPVNGTIYLQFTLWDDPVAGSQLGGAIIASPVTATDGLFTVELNGAGEFGASAFNGDARWLEISVCDNVSCAMPPPTLLSPRQRLTPAPTAFALPGLYTQQNGVNSPNIIGGKSDNSIAAGVLGGTIAGGGAGGASNNRVTDNYGTVAGGINNQAGNAGATNDREYATVGGGIGNTANGLRATIAGGDTNSAPGSRATVAGGFSNLASGGYATIPGGYDNTANSQYASALGGRENVASGDYSVAMGFQAQAAHNGTFVFNDSAGTPFASTSANQFLVRATGGAKLNVDTAGAGMRIEPTGTVSLPSMLLREGSNTITGHAVNQVSPGVICATIAGGGVVDDPQALGGGPFPLPNIVSATAGTVSGGYGNQAEGEASTISGGSSNAALGTGSSVMGGTSNLAEGDHSTVAGGFDNQAGGNYSFAAGRLARVRNLDDTNGVGADHGTFVWADSTNSLFYSSGVDQFLIRATGGVGIGTNVPTSPLTVAGRIESTSVGFRFPDGTLQSTAAVADLSASPILDPPDLSPGASDSMTVFVPGAVVGDVAVANADGTIMPIVIANVRVNTANSVQIQIVNAGTTNVDRPAMTWRIRVIK